MAVPSTRLVNLGIQPFGGATFSAVGLASNLAALKARSVSGLSTGYTVSMLGRTTKNDGGQGTFFYDSASVVTADDAVTIQPTSGTGRWIRLHDAKISVKWFGATGDGVTADHVAVNAAIAYVGAQGGGVLYFPKGTYLFTDHVFISYSNVHVTGDGIGNSILKAGAWVDCLRVSNGYPATTATIQNVEISHLEFNGNRTGWASAGTTDTYGNGININSTENFWIHHCFVHDTAQQGICTTFFGPSPYTAKQQGGMITDCIVDISNAIATGSIGIGAEGHFARFTISNNRVHCLTPAVGLYVGNAGEPGLDNGEVVVANNIVIMDEAVTSLGVHAEINWHNLAITGNVFQGGLMGIRADNIAGSGAAIATISGNSCRQFGAGGVGICTTNDAGVDRQTTVTGNVISSTLAVQAGALLGVFTLFSGNSVIVPGGSSTGVIIKDGCVVTANRIKSGGYSVDINGATTKTAMVAGNNMTLPVNNQFDGFVVDNYSAAGNWESGSRIYNRGVDIGGRRFEVSNAIPTTGAHTRGDVVFNQDSIASGFCGWCCITSGTPGTWKTFGAISP